MTDLHVHLLAALDDGPRTWDDAVEMCRIAAAEGTRYLAATAHQSERYPVSVETIREATQTLREKLAEAQIAVEIFPTGEIMAHPDMEESWVHGKLMSVADRKQYLLVEMPNGQFVDLRRVIQRFRQLGLRVILAHPERHPELLHESGAIEELIHLGCLVQVSAGSVTSPGNRRSERDLESWFRRGCVHFLASDGHSPRRRPPLMLPAYQRICGWVGTAVADTLCGSNGQAVLQGRILKPPEPRKKRRLWFWPW